MRNRRGYVQPARGIALVLAVTAWVVVMSTGATTLQEASRRDAIARFIEERKRFDIMCLYTFDRFRPSMNATSLPVVAGDDGGDTAADNSFLVTIPPTFEEHVGADCPFGDLQFDPQLVTSLNDGHTTLQQGVHLAEDSTNDRKRPQIASNDVVVAKDFYKWATTATKGYSFEFSYRRRVETNQTMTLFSISNQFGSCVDPGFRVDLISTHVLMLIYFFPVLEKDSIACYERRLFSAGRQPCVMPRFRPNIDDNPVVHVTVTIDATQGASNQRAGFYLKYVDPVTMESYECRNIDAVSTKSSILYDYIQGSYRLFIGNNPHNVSVPLKRSTFATIRTYRNPGGDNRPPTEQLHDMIKKKLDVIQGPRVPVNLGIFGGSGVSLSFLGIPAPVIGADSPYMWARDSIDDFKKEHLDDIVNFVVKGLQKNNKTKHILGLPSEDGGGEEIDDEEDGLNDSVPRQQGLYPDANGSTFDLFHFAMYRTPIGSRAVKQDIWPVGMTPLRPFMELNQTIRMLEDEVKELNLLHLHSIYDDIRLEIVELPALGRILLYPNKSALTESNLARFRELRMEEQQKIYFVPNPHENNQNIPGGGFARELDPYAIIRYRVWTTTTNRSFNSTREKEIKIFVDPVDDAPRLNDKVKRIEVQDGTPAYFNVQGIGEEGSAAKRPTLFGGWRHRSLFDGLESLSTGDFGGHLQAPSPQPAQNIRIIELPRCGRLYDQNMENTSVRLKAASSYEMNQLERYRIHHGSTQNRTFSTSLVYIFDERDIELPPGSVDKLTYQLRMGDSNVYSANASVIFRLPDSTPRIETNVNVVAVVQVDEDSAITLVLSEIDPLVAQLDTNYAFRVLRAPRHGRLYQYAEEEPSSTWSANMSIGPPIESSDELVIDDRGRLVYVPDPNYFNAFGDVFGDQYDKFDEQLDSFDFEVTSTGGRLRDSNSSDQTREDQNEQLSVRSIEVMVLNVPDALTILPPTIFSVNATRGDAVSVPIIFDDPDSFSGSYHVTIEANDDGVEFQFGHVVSDDDVLKFCPFERPCHLTRSANESFVSSDKGDGDELPEWQLTYLVKTRAWNPSQIDVQGSRTALQSALAKLILKDMSVWTWYSDHTVRFEVTIKRVNGTFDAKTKMKYYVDFTRGKASDADTLGHALSSLADLISMIAWLALIGFILSSASCCSMGFCCCCTRARAQKRQQFDDARQRFIEQVVQNDYEYSALLMTLVNVLLEPKLDLSIKLLQASGSNGTTQRTPTQALCLKSLMPLLRTEQLDRHLILRLFWMEFQNNDWDDHGHFLRYPSIAGAALVEFCQREGHSWIRVLQGSILSCDVADKENVASSVLTILERTIDDLPEAIGALCQSCAAMVAYSMDCNEALGVHIVFFNHFVGPALWFTREDAHGTRLTRSQKQQLRDAARDLVHCGVGGDASDDGVDGTRARYQLLLLAILKAPVNTNSPHIPETDCELVTSSLTILHSIIESILPALEAAEKMCMPVEGDPPDAKDEDTSGEVEISSVAKVKRILRALNFPLASADTLISSCASTLASDRLFWEGFSSGEWQARIAEVGHRSTSSRLSDPSKPSHLRHAESLLSVDAHHIDEETNIVFESTRSCDPPTYAHKSRATVEFEF